MRRGYSLDNRDIEKLTPIMWKVLYCGYDGEITLSLREGE